MRIAKNGCPKVILLKCTSAYPASTGESNLKTIIDLKKTFKCDVGFSDHTLGIGAALAAIATGASVIEKHFTLSKKDKGVDTAFSMDVSQLKLLVKEAKNAYYSIGKINYKLSNSEKNQKFLEDQFTQKITLKKVIYLPEKISK